MRVYFPDNVGALCDSWTLGVCPLGDHFTQEPSRLCSNVSFRHVNRRTFSRKPYKSLPLSDCVAPISQERAVAKENCRNMDRATYISLPHSYLAGRTPH